MATRLRARLARWGLASVGNLWQAGGPAPAPRCLGTVYLRPVLVRPARLRRRCAVHPVPIARAWAGAAAGPAEPPAARHLVRQLVVKAARRSGLGGGPGRSIAGRGEPAGRPYSSGQPLPVRRSLRPKDTRPSGRVNGNRKLHTSGEIHLGRSGRSPVDAREAAGAAVNAGRSRGARGATRPLGSGRLGSSSRSERASERRPQRWSRKEFMDQNSDRVLPPSWREQSATSDPQACRTNL